MDHFIISILKKLIFQDIFIIILLGIYHKKTIIINNDQDITCSICLEDLINLETVYEYASCKHKFHIDCIKFWLKH